MSKTLTISIIYAFLLLTPDQPAYAQNTIDLRAYFSPQNQSQYTLQYGVGADTTVRLTKIVKVQGKDTIEVSDYDKDNAFAGSLTYVVDNSGIKIIGAKRRIKEKIFDSRIVLDRWAQKEKGSSPAIRFDMRTEDTCSDPTSGCLWEWIRLRQTELKEGHIYHDNKKYKILTLSFDVLTLYQPKYLSSLAGLTTDKHSYVFAEGIGLIKIITTNKKYKFSQTLTLIN